MRACAPDGGLLHALTHVPSDRDTLTVLGYTLRHGAEARFLASAAEEWASVETRRFERTAHAPSWELTMLRDRST